MKPINNNKQTAQVHPLDSFSPTLIIEQKETKRSNLLPTIETQELLISNRKIQTTNAKKEKIFNKFFDMFFPLLVDFAYMPSKDEDNDIEMRRMKQINFQEAQRREKDFFQYFGISAQDCLSLMLNNSIDQANIENFLANIANLEKFMVLRMRSKFQNIASKFFNLLICSLESSPGFDQEIINDLKNLFLFESNLCTLNTIQNQLKDEYTKVFPQPVQKRKKVDRPVINPSVMDEKPKGTELKAQPIVVQTSADKLKEITNFIADLAVEADQWYHSIIMHSIEKLLSIVEADLNENQIALLNSLKNYLRQTASLYCQSDNPNFLFLGLKLQRALFPKEYEITLKQKYSPKDPQFNFAVYDQYDFFLVEDRINLGCSTFSQIAEVTINCPREVRLMLGESITRDKALSKMLFKFLSENNCKLVNLKSLKISGQHFGEINIPVIDSLEEIELQNVYQNVEIPTLKSLISVSLKYVRHQVSIKRQSQLMKISISYATKVTIEGPQPKNQLREINQKITVEFIEPTINTDEIQLGTESQPNTEIKEDNLKIESKDDNTVANNTTFWTLLKFGGIPFIVLLIAMFYRYS